MTASKRLLNCTRWHHRTAVTVVTALAFGPGIGILAQESANGSIQNRFYQVYSDVFDETGLPADEQERKNRISYGAILAGLSVHNASIPIGFVPYPVWVGMAAEAANLTADNTLKFTRAVLRAPPNIARVPNAVDPAFPTDGLCRFEFTLPQSTARFSNFLGLWPRLTYGPDDRVDRLFLPNDTPIDFGDLGIPEVVHAVADVDLDVLIDDDPDFQAHSALSQKISLSQGVHSARWNAATRFNLVLDRIVPAALIPIMASMEARWAKYIDDFLEPAKTLRTTARELGSPTSAERRKLLRWLFVKINLLRLVKKAVPALAKKGTEEILDYILEGKPVVGRARLQNVTVYDNIAPTIETLVAHPTFEATDVGGARATRYFNDLRSTINASDACGQPFTVQNDVPELLPLGDTVVTWTVRDHGPVMSGVDHDGDGMPDSDAYNSRTITQIVTIEDTQAPILVPPPGVVIESNSVVDLATAPLGQPLVVDLADLHPTVASSTPNGSGSVDPDTRTVVTWTATDASGNASTADQLVTAKTPGTNTAPTVTDQQADTLTSTPVDIVLTGFDADVLPLTGDATGPGVRDPLQFKIEQRPQNGEFITPLLPFFINDYRTDTTGVLTDDVAFAQAPNQLAWLDNEYCANSQPIPVNFVFNPLFVHVTDAGDTYFLDHYAECGQFGESAVENLRISHWAADRSFLGHVDYNPSGGTHSSSFVYDRNGKIYYLLSFGVNEFYLQVCDANITGTNGSCNNGYLFDSNNSHGLTISRSRYARVDSSAGGSSPDPLIYLTDGSYVNIYQGGAYRGQLVNDVGNPSFLASQSVCQPIPGGGSNQAYGMDVDSQGNLYIADTCADRIHKFTASTLDDQNNLTPGQYVGWMGQCTGSTNLACDVDAHHSKGFSCTDSTCTVGGDGSGSDIGQFHDPVFLAIDPNDVLYVADYTNQRVQRFAPDGTFGGLAQSTGNGINASTHGAFVLGNMGPPRHVSVNSRQFFVVDQAERFVHVFQTSPFKDVTDSSATVSYVSNYAFHSDTDTFVYSVNDGLVNSNLGTVSINVARNYRQPLPMPQTVDATEDLQKVIVLTGIDPDGIQTRDFNGLDSLTFSTKRAPAHGTLVAGGDPGGITIDPGMAVFTYTPDRDYHGTDSFTFTVRDAFTDETTDGGTAIPEPYGEAEPVEVAITVASVNDVPVVQIDPPERVAAGFPYVLSAAVYDDAGDNYAARVSWGDGVVDRDGKAIVDQHGTPNDTSDDTSMLTGIVYSEDGLATTGQTQLTAIHTYVSTGARKLSTCVRDGGRLEACDDLDINVESLAVLSPKVDLSTTKVFDGIAFSGTISVLNAVPMGGVTGLDASDVEVRTEIPPELLVLGATPSQGVCTIDSGLLDCTLGALPNGATASIALNLRGAGTVIYDTDTELRAEVTTTTASLGDSAIGSASVAITAVPSDRDGDGLPNVFEDYYGVSAPHADDDGDGLDNAAELAARTSPTNPDTDGDGLSDGAENAYGTDALNADSDADGLSDYAEITTHGTNPLAADSDGDGLPDQWEIDNGFDPLVDDGAGDADGDGLSDADEYRHSSDYLVADTDGDGLTDGAEVHTYDTDPANADTDGDGLADGAELAAGTDARKPDSDDDGLLDGPEVLQFATSPTHADTDRDGLTDGWEVRNGRSPLIADYAVAAGGLSSCALTDAGVECWGRNDLGQAPAVVPGLTDPQQITVGYVHACAIDRSPAGVPSVKCWGDNTYNQRTPPPLVAPFQVAAGGYHTCALDRTTPTTTAVVCWGRDNYGQVSNRPTGLTNPVQLVSSVSGNDSCVLDDAAGGPELVCWGRDDSGEVSNAPSGLTSVFDPLALGSEHGCLVDGGNLRCWGLNTDGQAPPGPTPSTAVAFALGGFHSCALGEIARDRYTVDCWGLDVNGQASVPTSLVHPIGIAAGSHHTCALDDGAAKCWGVETQFDQGQAPALRALDIDPDGDGISTADELVAGTDPLDADTDRDGLSDAAEVGAGTDPLDDDSDDDGVIDGDEVNLYTSNPLDADSDGDGLPDGWEVDNGSLPTVSDATEDADADGLSSKAEYAHGTNPNLADTDGDGIADGDELQVFRYEDSGQALGTATSEAVALGDLDNDGDLDAFVGSRDATHEIWLNDGTGTFTQSNTSTLNAFTATDVELFDVDGDGDLDAYLGHPNPAVPNSFWLNEGGAVFSDVGALQPPPTVTEGLAYGRVSPGPEATSHGLFVANWGANQAGTFFPPFDLQLGTVDDQLAGNSEDVALGDFNHDGLDDAFVVNRGQPDQVFMNLGQSPAAFAQTAPLPRSDQSAAVALGDIDADGDLDAFEAVEGAGDRIWLNDGAGAFTDSGQSLGNDSDNDVRLLDIDSDGYPEALVASSGPNRLWRNNAGLMADSGIALGNATTLGLDVGDLDGDGDPDAFFANDGPNEVWLLNQLKPGDADTDGDGALDGWEIAHGLDPLDATDGALDADADGLSNRDEFDSNSDPLVADTDGDGTPDGTDAFLLDPAESLDTDGDGIGNNADPDDDNDGVPDASDAFPLDSFESADADGDGIGDNADPDDDNDGISDVYEAAHGLNPLLAADASQDLDGDGLTNLEEFQLGTAADNPDTDHDGVDDKTELDSGRNPLVNERAAGALGPINLLLLDD